MGDGRFGAIYRAQDQAIGALVAIRTFDQGFTAAQASAVAAALDRLCQTPLDHPAILSPVAAGAEGEIAWLAEPCLAATPLDRVMRRDGAQPLVDVLLRVTQIAGAIDFAAAVGVHHGALHPRDVLLSDHATVITGLGVLQALNDAGLNVRMEGAYVSPQRLLGEPVSIGDDIYALGVITFELVYGQAAPPPSDIGAAMTRLMTGVDQARFRDVIERAVAGDAAARPATALEFAAALQEALVDRELAGAVPAAADSFGGAVPDVESPGAAVPPADIPLRRDEGLALELAWEPQPATPRTRAPQVQARPAHVRGAPVRPRSSWSAMAAMLAIGLLSGFAIGFVAGRQDMASTPVPRSAERAASRPHPPESPAGSAAAAAERSNAATVQEQDLRLPQAPARPERSDTDERPEGSERSQPEQSQPERSGPAVLRVDSRPRGARVFMNGRLVGQTPLSLSDVTPGTYAVRIDMTGYQRWVTTVDIAAGDRARVAASLER